MELNQQFHHKDISIGEKVRLKICKNRLGEGCKIINV